MKRNITLEQALDRLKEITDILENNNIPLDEALKLYEEGNNLTKICKDKIETAKLKISIINSSEKQSDNNED